jgi:hypothetical protein
MRLTTTTAAPYSRSVAPTPKPGCGAAYRHASWRSAVITDESEQLAVMTAAHLDGLILRVLTIPRLLSSDEGRDALASHLASYVQPWAGLPR